MTMLVDQTNKISNAVGLSKKHLANRDGFPETSFTMFVSDVKLEAIKKNM